jgi:hypothetical protein
MIPLRVCNFVETRSSFFVGAISTALSRAHRDGHCSTRVAICPSNGDRLGRTLTVDIHLVVLRASRDEFIVFESDDNIGVICWFDTSPFSDLDRKLSSGSAYG